MRISLNWSIVLQLMIWPFVSSMNGATSHGIVCTMQNTCVDCLLRVLCQQNDDETFGFTPGSEPIFGTKKSSHQCDHKCTLGQRGTYCVVILNHVPITKILIPFLSRARIQSLIQD
jgi:hypothetical protein